MQDILFYRALGVELALIRECLDSPSFNRLAALHHYLAALQAKKTRLETLIRSVEETIDCEERNEAMNDEAKFSAFKQQAIDNNEATYGQEVRERYGDAAADETNAALMGLSCEEYAAWNELDLHRCASGWNRLWRWGSRQTVQKGGKSANYIAAGCP